MDEIQRVSPWECAMGYSPGVHEAGYCGTRDTTDFLCRYLFVLPYPIWHLGAPLPPHRPAGFLRRRPAGAVLGRANPVKVLDGTSTPMITEIEGRN